MKSKRKLQRIWSVAHEVEDQNFCEHYRLIGYFRTREEARRVLREIRTKPGFRDHPKDVFFGANTVDGAGAWEEGFVTMMDAEPMPEPDEPCAAPVAFTDDVAFSPDGLWLVEHRYLDQWGCENHKGIGVYSAVELARQAVRSRLDQPGFRRSREGFSIQPITLGKAFWQSGF